MKAVAIALVAASAVAIGAVWAHDAREGARLAPAAVLTPSAAAPPGALGETSSASSGDGDAEASTEPSSAPPGNAAPARAVEAPAAHEAENATFVRINAIEATAVAGDASALPRLCAQSLRDDPEVAAPLVRAIGHLAASAPLDAKNSAASTLAAWLSHELAEDSAFARGNVSLLIDALADTGSPSAVAPLARALDAGSLPIHQATRAVEALGALGDPRAVPSITRFAERLDREGTLADLDPALVAEAREAARTATAQLAAR